MKKFISFFFLAWACLPLGYLQNLVPNGSMEIKTKCPETYGEINLAEGWFSSLNSPDYFNSCNTGQYNSLIRNLAGTQMPFQGNAYCAMVCKHIGSDYQEHQGVKLTQSLVVGNIYQCRMWVSLCEISSFGSNNIGFQFGTTDSSWQNNISQVYTDQLITEKAKWVLISGNFIATRPYTYVFVGNFFEDSNTKSVSVSDGTYEGAYYYVDSISVAPMGSSEVIVDVLPSLTPGVFTVTNVKPGSLMIITRASGEAIYNANCTSSNTEIDLSKFGRGTYCIIAESITGETVRKIITY
jgi:hypothetical protein